MVFITEFLWGLACLEGFRFGGSSVLVGTADEEGWSVSQLAESGEYICTENAADDVAQVRYVIDVRERAGNEDILFALLGEDDLGGCHGELMLGVTIN